jgi:oligoribonuclease NrnB/cAMP/cGMP phosphodiesterase (DHH superfamily)
MCYQACALQWRGFRLLENRTRNYILSQGHAIWEIVKKAYVIPAMLDNVTQVELQRYENNYKALHLITTTLGRNVYDRVSHLETANDVMETRKGRIPIFQWRQRITRLRKRVDVHGPTTTV